MLAARGYNMIGVDNSWEMLSVAQERADEDNLSDYDILYLLQDMREFELYGTVRAVVSVSKVYTIIDGLKESGVVELNEDLLKIYTDWEEENPFNEGMGWGTEPWSQEEMPLSDEVAKKA